MNYIDCFFNIFEVFPFALWRVIDCVVNSFKLLQLKF